MIEVLVEGAEMAAEAAAEATEVVAEAAEAAEIADAVGLAGQESLAIDEAELGQLEAIAAENDEQIGILGDRKSGWCMKSICQGEFSSFACRGCIGKASDHTTK